jgi:hypothetical protein
MASCIRNASLLPHQPRNVPAGSSTRGRSREKVRPAAKRPDASAYDTRGLGGRMAAPQATEQTKTKIARVFSRSVQQCEFTFSITAPRFYRSHLKIRRPTLLLIRPEAVCVFRDIRAMSNAPSEHLGRPTFRFIKYLLQRIAWAPHRPLAPDFAPQPFC